MSSAMVMEITCATARVAGECLPVNLVPASAEDAVEGCEGMTSLNAPSPQRLTSRVHHNIVQQRKAWRGSWWTPTIPCYSKEEGVDGPQTTRHTHKYADTTTTRCTVERIAETTELDTQAQVASEGCKYESWLGPPVRQSPHHPGPQRMEQEVGSFGASISIQNVNGPESIEKVGTV